MDRLPVNLDSLRLSIHSIIGPKRLFYWRCRNRLRFRSRFRFRNQFLESIPENFKASRNRFRRKLYFPHHYYGQRVSVCWVKEDATGPPQDCTQSSRQYPLVRTRKDFFFYFCFVCLCVRAAVQNTFGPSIPTLHV